MIRLKVGDIVAPNPESSSYTISWEKGTITKVYPDGECEVDLGYRKIVEYNDNLIKLNSNEQTTSP